MSSFDNFLFIQENVDFVNEAFVGKTKTLEEIEKKIGEIRPKIKYTGANSTLKEVLELNRLFEKQFGMEIYALKIVPTDMVNAWTMVLANNFDIAMYENLPSMIEADQQNGYRFKPDNGFCINANITTGLIMDMNYSDEEILAILLHELGHNFADCIYDDINIANRDMMNGYRKVAVLLAILYAISLIGIPRAIKILKDLATFNNSTKKKAEKKSQKIGKGKLAAFMNAIKAKTNDVYIFVSAVLSRLTGSANLNIAKRFLSIYGNKEEAKKSLDRQNEVIADKFAGVYGYGPALATALIKLESTPTKVDKFVGKFGKFGEKMNELYDDLLRDINDYDSHPQVIQRIYEEIKLLENELKKEDVDPKMKKVIENQLKQLKQIVKDATTVKEEMSKSEQAQILYNQFINNECSDAVEKKIEEKIEDALDKALNGG